MNADVRFAPPCVSLTDPQGGRSRPQGARRALVVALVALLPARGVSDVPQRPSEVSGRQLCLELPDCSDADAVNLR